MAEKYAQLTERRDLALAGIQSLRAQSQLVKGMYYRSTDTDQRFLAIADDQYELLGRPPVAEQPSMIDPSVWYEVPQGSPASAYPPGWQALNGKESENAIVTTDQPDGSMGLSWHCIPSGDSGGDGGFNYGGNPQPIDTSKTYRICSWFRRNGNMNGSSYHGLHNYDANGVNVGVMNAADANSSANSNFYMFYGDLPTVDKWFMVVSYLHPVGSPAMPRRGGIYQYGSLDKQADILQDGRFVPGTQTISVRDYLYYANQPNGSSQHISLPRIDLVDGSEPALSELLGLPSADGVKVFENSELLNGWENYAGMYQKLTAAINNGVVTIQGLVRSGTGVIANLPEIYRPSGRLILNQQHGHSAVMGRVDVLANGDIEWQSGDTGWVPVNASYLSKWKALGENR